MVFLVFIRKQSTALESVVSSRFSKFHLITCITKFNMGGVEEHKQFMSVAYEEALQGYNEGGVPVGAVMTKDGKIIARYMYM